MKNFILVCFILLLGCQNSTPKQTESAQLNDTTVIDKSNHKEPTKSINLKQDLTWKISLDIQEGYLLEYTITEKSGKKMSYKIDETIPIIGGVDHPEPYFINDTTYYIPNAGSSKNGHYEMYIYQNGSATYKEVDN